jgi:hypothetical protein
MLLAKRAELRAVYEILTSMHAHEMAFKVEKAAVDGTRRKSHHPQLRLEGTANQATHANANNR